jgi:cobalt/nickel transport system permease protein
VALQLAVSGTSPANVALPAMAGIHALIGIGEGLITAGALAFLFAARRDLLQAGSARPARSGNLAWAIGLVIALALAVLSPIASSNPDGLEWVAEQAGFLETAREATFTIIPDYVMPGVSDEALATIIAGVVGTVLVFGIALAVAWSRSRNRAVSSGAVSSGEGA